MISKCGYRCDLCLIHETNLKGEDDKQRMSDALAKYYDYTVPPEQIEPCKGCQHVQTSPDPGCQVFPCVQEKGLETCAHCPDFGCDKLKQRMDLVEECLERHPNVPSEDYDLFFKPYLSRTTLMEIRESLSG
jgi:hypothetical protein